MHLVSAAAEPSSDPSIDRPIFCLGVPRSGTTLTLAMMACHPQLAWASQFTNRVPTRPELAFYSRILDLDPIRRRLPAGSAVTPRPSEPYVLLNHLTDHTFTEPRLLDAEDVTPEVAARFRRSVRAHIHWQGKSRYLQKHTGFPRTAYLQAIFPDGRFVHILRDGRAVAASLTRVGFFDGTEDSWWWGSMRAEYEEEYLRSGKSAIVLAAITWKTLVDLIEPAMAALPPGQGMTMRYDDLLARPEETIEDVGRFCGLELVPSFWDRMRLIRVSGSDDKWKQLPSEERRLLEASLGGHLQRLGFPV